MKTDHRQIQSRQQSRSCHGKIPQNSQERRHLKTVVPVLPAFQKAVKIPRKDQCHRRIIAKQHDLSVKDFLGCTVRALCCLILGKRREPGILCKLLQHTTVQNPVDLKLLQPFLHLFQKFLPCQIFHVQNLYQSMGTTSDIVFHHLHSGIPKPLPYQSRIGFH